MAEEWVGKFMAEDLAAMFELIMGMLAAEVTCIPAEQLQNQARHQKKCPFLNRSMAQKGKMNVR